MTVKRENQKKQEYLPKGDENNERKLSTGSGLCTGLEYKSELTTVRERISVPGKGKIRTKDGDTAVPGIFREQRMWF